MGSIGSGTEKRTLGGTADRKGTGRSVARRNEMGETEMNGGMTERTKDGRGEERTIAIEATAIGRWMEAAGVSKPRLGGLFVICGLTATSAARRR